MAKEKKSPQAGEEVDIDNPENITFDYKGMSNNLNLVLKDIDDRQKSADTKLTALKGKEDILNKIITNTNLLLEKTDPQNFKLIGVYQNQIMTQLESFNLLQESLMKYEDLIQRYIKMKIDIENHKLSSFAKIKTLYKANDTADQGFETLLKNMHTLTQSPSQVFDIQQEAQKQLKLQGY
jgi:hypothetical protein